MRNVDEKSKEFRAYRTQLDAIVQEVYLIVTNLHGWSVEKWAEKAGLNFSTVYKLLNRTTRFPMYRTVYLLAKCAGCEVWVKNAKAATKKKVPA